MNPKDLANVAKSVVELATAMGETPCAELLKLAEGTEIEGEQSDGGILALTSALTKSVVKLSEDIKAQKAAYPYPYPEKKDGTGEEKYPYPEKKAELTPEEKAKLKAEEVKATEIADVLLAVQKLSASVEHLVALGEGKIQTAEKKAELTPEEKAKLETEKQAKLAAGEVKAAVVEPVKIAESSEAVSPTGVEDLVKGEVAKTLQRMGFIESGARVIPVDADRKPGLLAKGGKLEEALADADKLAKMSFQEINKYRMLVGALK